MITIKCPACGSKQVMTKRDGTSWCRKCGHSGPTETFKQSEEEKK